MNDPTRPSDEDAEMLRCVTDRGIVLTLGGRLFVNGRADLGPMSSVLDRLVTLLRGYPDSDITIEGHTDTLGSDGYNYNLSQRRADSIKMYLIEKRTPLRQVANATHASKSSCTLRSHALTRRRRSAIHADEAMTFLLIGALVILSAYLAMRLHSAHAENETLRATVISLKRQLVKHRT
jgi:hypothetical protein